MGYLQGMLNSLWSGCIMTSLAVGAITGFFVLILILGNGWGHIPRLLLWVGPGLAVIGVLAVPWAMLNGWEQRPRRIWIEDDAFVVKMAFRTKRLPFDKCYWSLPKPSAEDAGFYLPSYRLIVITTLERDRKRIACGYTEETFRTWKAFVRLQGIPFQRRTSLVMWVQWFGGGGVTGSILGLLVGAIATALLGDPAWVMVVGLLGWIDGCFWGGYRLWAEVASPALLRRWSSNQIGRSVFSPLLGFAIGLQIARGAAFPIDVSIGLLNAIALGIVGRNCEAKLRERMASDAEECEDDELSWYAPATSTTAEDPT
jgi:hypothetical protein